MKILVLQLARLGDVYLSWPAIRALRRTYPMAEIHLLTRPRFAAAAEGLTAVQKVIHLPTSEILAPLAQEDIQVNTAFAALSNFVDQLANENYDWVVNFSFSPFSSYLTHAVAGSQAKVFGYTRHQDGFLAIPDDVSAYFYAQVGQDRPNRFHLVEMFTSQVGLDLVPEDWRGPSPFPATQKILPAEYIVVHIGASDLGKALPPEQWVQIIQNLRANNPIAIVLVGSPDEEPIAQKMVEALGDRDIVNCVGKTQLNELFPILKSSRLLVGCDSAPIHMATYTNTPVVNLSYGNVNFWETGPRSLESVVLRIKTEADVDAIRIADVIHRAIAGQKQELGITHVTAGTPSYWCFNSKESDFDWFFARALYMGEDFPTCEDPNFASALKQMRDINSLMVQQIQVVEKTGDVSRAAPFIERGEEIIETIAKLVPALQILVRWYQTEKIRIPPGEMMQVLHRTLEIHLLLQKVLDLYEQPTEAVMKEVP